MPQATTPFSDPVFEAILTRIESGESVLSICRDPDMPHHSNFYRWLRDKEGLVDRYRLAREIQAEILFAEILEIADESASDWLAATAPDKPPKANTEHIQRAKLRIDTRKWLVAKLAPKKYGERVALEHDLSDSVANLLAALERGKARAANRSEPKA